VVRDGEGENPPLGARVRTKGLPEPDPLVEGKGEMELDAVGTKVLEGDVVGAGVGGGVPPGV